MQLTENLGIVERRISTIENTALNTEGISPEVAPNFATILQSFPNDERDNNFDIDRMISQSSTRWNVDPNLVRAIVANESGFDTQATSAAGARGLMQLMPQTAAALGVTDPYDAAQNIGGGTRYLRGLLDRFHGNVRLAVAAYNAGPNAVARYHDVPPYAETRAYVANVLASYEKYQRHA